MHRPHMFDYIILISISIFNGFFTVLQTGFYGFAAVFAVDFPVLISFKFPRLRCKLRFLATGLMVFPSRESFLPVLRMCFPEMVDFPYLLPRCCDGKSLFFGFPIPAFAVS